MPRQYYRHYELIQESFVFQNLNDHCNPSYHQPLLVARRDLNLSDAQWLPLRDACWIQNCWSASITPKGAFFCEMAAALDMLFIGPGGWRIERGWWRRTPAEFADQLHWCELCGAALPLPRRNANDQLDDVSDRLLRRLEQLNSPKLRQGQVVRCSVGTPAEGAGQAAACTGMRPDEYIPEASQRLGATNHNLRPRALNGIVLSDSAWPADRLAQTLAAALAQLDQVVLLAPDDARDMLACLADLPALANDRHHLKERLIVLYQQEHHLGHRLLRAMQRFRVKDWVVVLSDGQALPADFRSELLQTFLNPGTWHSLHLNPAPLAPTASIMLYHQQAQALREAGQDRLGHCRDLNQIQQLWPAAKQVTLPFAPVDWTLLPEQEWMHKIAQDFSQDTVFREKFELVLSQAAPDKSPVLITQSAPWYLTRALTGLLLELAYTPHLLTHQRFGVYFEDLLPPAHIWTFNQSTTITCDAVTDLRPHLRRAVSFAGAIIPYGITRTMAEPADGYAEVERVALDLAGRVLGRVNMKRQFVVVRGHLTDIALL